MKAVINTDLARFNQQLERASTGMNCSFTKMTLVFVLLQILAELHKNMIFNDILSVINLSLSPWNTFYILVFDNHSKKSPLTVAK